MTVDGDGRDSENILSPRKILGGYGNRVGGTE
jgi:hypothetical protein